MAYGNDLELVCSRG